MSWNVPPKLLFKAALWDLELAHASGDTAQIEQYETLMDSYWRGMKQSDRDEVTEGTQLIMRMRTEHALARS